MATGDEIRLVTQDQMLGLFTEDTGVQILEALNKQNLYLEVLAGDKMSTMDLKTFKKMSRSGELKQILNIGDQIFIQWTDTVTNKTYDVPLDIVHFGDAELENGETVSGTYLQWHYATPVSVQFDNYEAFYVAEEELPAGIYNIKIGNNWGNNCKADTIYSFTLTNPVPKGGQLSGFTQIPDVQASALKVYSWKSSTDTSPIETVSVRVAEEGTNLGTLVNAGNELNSLQRVGYGYGRYGQSAIRQWLNSDAAVSKWWTPQNDYDRPPAELSQRAGFLTGFSEEFLDIVEKIKIKTALNTVIPADKAEGYDITYEKIWLIGAEQTYIKPDGQGEGEAFDYWKKASGRTSPCEWWQTYPNMITYAVENHKSAQVVRTRSSKRDGAHRAWCVDSSGNVSYATASWPNRSAPVCFV